MERAGLAAAELARELAGGSGKPVLVLAGPGNNGGDAFVVARHLKQWWFNVTVVFAGDEKKLSADAAAALARLARRGRRASWTRCPRARDWGLVVDGMFGIGLEREVTGRYAEWIAAINELPRAGARAGRAERPAIPIPAACWAARCAQPTRSRSSR